MTGKKWLQLQSRNRRKPYLAADDVDHRFINANRKLWRSGTRRLEKLFTHTHTSVLQKNSRRCVWSSGWAWERAGSRWSHTPEQNRQRSAITEMTVTFVRLQKQSFIRAWLRSFPPQLHRVLATRCWRFCTCLWMWMSDWSGGPPVVYQPRNSISLKTCLTETTDLLI